MRLDQYLCANGYVETVKAATALVMAGSVYVNGNKAEKAGDTVPDKADVVIRDKKIPFVSRGGLKLEKAMRDFSISLQDKICMDVGASTGGFTDCMLQNGAKKVYAVDVAYGQLAWSLRTDERVVNMERTNIRKLQKNDLQDEDEIEFFSVDVSFISLKIILPILHKITSESATGVCLVKPQFEAKRAQVGKNGVVSSKDVHEEVLQNSALFTRECGFGIVGMGFSPIKGPKGNIEFLISLKKNDILRNEDLCNIEQTVEQAHNNFLKQEHSV